MTCLRDAAENVQQTLHLLVFPFFQLFYLKAEVNSDPVFGRLFEYSSHECVVHQGDYQFVPTTPDCPVKDLLRHGWTGSSAIDL